MTGTIEHDAEKPDVHVSIDIQPLSTDGFPVKTEGRRDVRHVPVRWSKKLIASAKKDCVFSVANVCGSRYSRGPTARQAAWASFRLVKQNAEMSSGTRIGVPASPRPELARTQLC